MLLSTVLHALRCRDGEPCNTWWTLLQISAKYQPRTDDGKSWSYNYHTKLYNLTDEAIRGEADSAHCM